MKVKIPNNVISVVAAFCFVLKISFGQFQRIEGELRDFIWNMPIDNTIFTNGIKVCIYLKLRYIEVLLEYLPPFINLVIR